MTTKRKIPIKQIILTVLAVVFWIVFFYMLFIASIFTDIGKAPPNGPEDMNGLGTGFAMIIQLYSLIPLFLAVLFTIISIFSFRKLAKTRRS